MPGVRRPGSRAPQERRHHLLMHLLQSHLGQPAWKRWARMIFILVLAIGCWWGYYKLRQILQSSAATGNPDRLDSVR